VGHPKREKPPNIVLIMTDQQRFDSIGALGASWMKTPHLDRLVNEGVSFNNCFVNSPVCVTSRASLFHGKYPHKTGVFHNFQPWSPVWVQWLADKGYHCVNIGKMHINPYHELGGFHQRFPVENKDRPLFLNEHSRAFYDEWDKALKARGLKKPSRYNRYKQDPKKYLEALGCFEWELPEELHSDFFVGDFAKWWLEDRQSDAPLFLQIGFPGPHPPYDPVPRFLDLYKNTNIPVPDVTRNEIARQPHAQAMLRANMIEFNFDSIHWKNAPTNQELLSIRRHYAANVSMIDEKVGEIIRVLEKKNYLDNTLVIFTSDHADALGDHGHIQKWTMYDTVLRVPLIFWGPKLEIQNRSIDTPVELMDIASTVLELADIPIPSDWDSSSLWPSIVSGTPPVDGVVYSELARDHIQTGSEFIVMRRDDRIKIVWYLGETYGELYDLQADPLETVNLWEDPRFLDERDLLIQEIKDRIMSGMLHARDTALPTPQQPMKTN
jgi:arylsulfatase